MEIESRSYLITLPLIPSHQGRGNELLEKLFIPSATAARAVVYQRIGRFPGAAAVPARLNRGCTARKQRDASKNRCPNLYRP